jgi:hypothetical protein
LVGSGGSVVARSRLAWVAGCGVPGEILVLTWSEPAEATPAGASDFIGSITEGFSSRSHGLSPEGNLRSLGSSDGGTVTYFIFARGIVSESTMAWGLVVGSFSMWLLRHLARGRCGQFGNDDTSSRVWVAVQGLIVGLRCVWWVLLCFIVSL